MLWRRNWGRRKKMAGSVNGEDISVPTIISGRLVIREAKEVVITPFGPGNLLVFSQGDAHGEQLAKLAEWTGQSKADPTKS
jgi:hypothetical protein